MNVHLSLLERSRFEDLITIGEEGGRKKRAVISGHIIEQARNLFWLKGYEKTTIRNIADACSCTPGNIYNYFTSKEEILFKILRDEMVSLTSMLESLEHDNSTSPIEQLRIFIQSHVYHTLGPVKGQLLLFEMEWRHLSPYHQRQIIELRDIYDRILRKIILRGIDAGLFGRVNEKLFNYAIASMIVQARTTWYSPEGELSISELSEAIFRLFLNGLRYNTKT